jgi:hypothetical protein
MPEQPPSRTNSERTPKITRFFELPGAFLIHRDQSQVHKITMINRITATATKPSHTSMVGTTILPLR